MHYILIEYVAVGSMLVCVSEHSHTIAIHIY